VSASKTADQGSCAVRPWFQGRITQIVLIFAGVVIGLHSRGRGTTPRLRVEFTQGTVPAGEKAHCEFARRSE
jgi:hypothetical protein